MRKTWTSKPEQESNKSEKKKRTKQQSSKIKYTKQKWYRGDFLFVRKELHNKAEK